MKKKLEDMIVISQKAKGYAAIIKSKMEELGTYKPEFNHLIELMAQTIDNYNRCMDVVNKSGFSETTEKGGNKTMPEAQLVVVLGNQVKQLSEQLMLTPKGMPVGNKKVKDDLAEIMPLKKVN